METSDSDYFESADEDISSDDEKTNSVIINKDVKGNAIEIEKKVNRLDVNDINNKCKIGANLACGDIKKSDQLNTPAECNENKENLCSGDDRIDVDTKISKSEKIDRAVTDNKKNKEENIWDDENLCSGDDHINKKKVFESEKADCAAAVTNDKKNEEQNMWDDDELDWNEVETITKNQKPSEYKQTKKETVSNIKATECDKSEENMWEDDQWEAIDESHTVTRDDKKIVTNSSWGGWGNWDVSSILNTATQGVSTLTSHVSQGLTTVLETGMGIPDPDELARINKAEKEKIRETDSETTYEKSQTNEPNTSSNLPSRFGFGNIVSGVSQITKLVESTSNKVISGGLDTLETIGKKTMEVLQEGDLGLKKKRAFLKIDQDKPVLSQLLREAKEKAEDENKILEQKHFSRKANYESLFDDHQGLVHLEALEMLSKQCDIKLQTLMETLTGNTLTEMQETMEQIRELCEIVEEEDEEQSFDEIKEKLSGAVGEIDIPISYDKLITTWTETDAWLTDINLNVCSDQELHQQAIEALAQLTAISVEQFHKAGELLLIKEHRSTADEADSLVQLTTALTSLIGIVAAKFSDKLNTLASKSQKKDDINNLITNVFYEAANSSSYIQDAFQLLLPVLQVGAV